MSYQRNKKGLKRKRAMIALMGKCNYCGSTENLTIDHIIPYKKAPRGLGQKNWQVLCEKCNGEKADLLVTKEDKNI